jgi:hypothetical protein
MPVQFPIIKERAADGRGLSWRLANPELTEKEGRGKSEKT